MRRRVIAWLAIVALVMGAVLPAHASGHARHGAAWPGGNDLCVGGKLVKAPALPASVERVECAKCCGSGGGVAPPSGAAATHALTATALALELPATPVVARVARDPVRARGPPSSD